MHSRTRIVATVGPASDSDETLDAMIAAGADVFRLNLSHGTLEQHLALIPRIRQRAQLAGAVVAVLADLPGPKVRAGDFGPDGVTLVPGSGLALVTADGTSGAAQICVDYPTLLADLSAGDRVVIGDGAISLSVVSVDDTEAWCTVLTGGTVRGRPGVHLPSEHLQLGTPTSEDLVLARMMVAAGVDFLAVSFVRRADDLRAVRAAIAPATARLVAKIETVAALGHLDEIIAEANALMVARGDLGIECPLEDVPHLQKRIIRACVEAAVPVVTATQMMESMVTAPSPTRAEVSDVANAVLDGTDALMLSGETAVGADPALVVGTMSQ
ncbi:MAG TPA: pyruvate kinase, partial [Ilumatobacteraceae bacterium]|nr:pyruvate kinase [Ilumatobacteraceae bacterium]